MDTKKVLICPHCHVQLEMMQDGRLCCRSCQKIYVIMKKAPNSGDALLSSAVAHVRSSADKPAEGEQQGKRKKGRKWPLVLLFLLLLLSLLACGLLVLREGASASDPREFDQAELDSYNDAQEAAPPSARTTGKPGDLDEGDPASITGMVSSVGDDFVTLDNGVSCYANPEMFSPDELDSFRAALDQLEPGDVVGFDGMVCEDEPLTLKYCDTPYSYYGGTDFYRGYDAFLGGIPYPDTRYDAAVYGDYQELLGSGSSYALEGGQILSAYAAAGTDDGVQVVTDTYLHQALSVTGAVSDIHEGWFVVERHIYCFYENSQLTEEQLAEILALVLNQEVTVTGYCTNSSPDMTRLSYCTLGKADGAAPMAAPQVPESSAVPADLSTAQLAGSWQDSDSKRCHMEVTAVDEDTISVRAAWSSGAEQNTTWEMTAVYDAQSGRFMYTDCVNKDVTYGDTPKETVLYENGTGSFALRDGFLYWEDDVDQIRNGFPFEHVV